MTILGQQALLDEGDETERFLACRNCGSDLGEDGGNGVIELCTLKGSNNGGIRYTDEHALEFESDGYTSVDYDSYESTGFMCPQCHKETKTLDALVEWRTDDAG